MNEKKTLIAIRKVLAQWDLSCAEESCLKKLLAGELLLAVKNCNTPDVSVSLVDNKFMKWLAKEASELCEGLYGCIHEYETNER